MTYDKRILVLNRVCYLTFMFNVSNSKLYYIGYVSQHFIYIKEQEETVEWNQITYNGVLKYTGKIFMRLINQWLQVIS